MSQPFVAEIRIFGFNFAPKGWALCNGQLLPISQNTALFSLIGTYYGGDGKSTFALPDLQGQAPLQQGQGNGLSEYVIGEQTGVPNVTLLQSELPFHTHSLLCSIDDADLRIPSPTRALAKSAGGNIYSTSTSPLVNMAFQSLPPAGGSLPHDNMQPYLTLNFCIAMQGVFPARN